MPGFPLRQRLVRRPFCGAEFIADLGDADDTTRVKALQTVIAKVAELLQAPVKG